MGTLSKAYGSIGGFVAADAYVARILRLGCSAYGFTSTLPPDQAAAVLEHAFGGGKTSGAPECCDTPAKS